jgi:hypothetical protein
MTKDEVKTILDRPGRKTGSSSWQRWRWKSRRNFRLPATPRHRMNWRRSTKGSPRNPRARRKSRRPLPCSARNEGRIFEAGHRRSSAKRRLLRTVRQSCDRCKNRSPGSGGRGPNYPIAAERTCGRPKAGRSRRAPCELALQNLLQGGRRNDSDHTHPPHLTAAI